MKSNEKLIQNSKLLEIIIKKIERDFAEEISVLVCYGSYVKGDMHKYSDIDFFFIPKTKRGYNLSYQFIIRGIGYDLWPVSWDRADRISKLKEPLQSILLDGKVVYFSTNKDLERYNKLVTILKTNIQNETVPVLDPGSTTSKKEDKENQPNPKSLIGFYEELKSTYNKLKLACETENFDMAIRSANIIDNETSRALKYFIRGVKFPSLSISVLSKDFNKILEHSYYHEKELLKLLEKLNVPLSIFDSEKEFRKAFDQRI